MKKTDFNEDWSFRKEGMAEGQRIVLPHDAMLFEERRAGNPSTGACACFEGGKYIYEKHFMAQEEWKEKTVQAYFEGSYQNNEVLLNGSKIGGCAYGYSSFLVTLERLRYGKENVLEVKVDNSQVPNSRWYTGSGIYRPVSLLIGGKIHIRHQGIRITTLSVSPAVIRVETDCTGGEAEIEIRKEGMLVASASGCCAEISIPDACLWSDESPELYQCCVTLREDGRIVDEAEETFGIREITYSNKGLFVNGKETLLRGACVHSDNGILGAKSIREAEWRRVRKLKEAGYNAIRSSHNPCAEEMARACDFYGVYLIDELWDQWYFHKNKYDYADRFMDHYEYDIEAIVLKDYNHPSVIMYSIGNEVAEPADDKGRQMTRTLVDKLHELDPGRPVTGGFNLMILGRAAQGKGIYNSEEGGRTEDDSAQTPNSSMMFNIITSMVGTSMNKAANSKKVDAVASPALDTLDIAGYNYASGRYPMEGKLHPDRLIYGSETFPCDIVKNWKMVEQYPYLIGDFMWTGWDYLGEAGAGAWGYTDDARGFEKPYPWLLADMGTMDILGDPNGELFLAQAVWHTSDKPGLAVQPVNHPGITPAKSSWRGTNAIPSWSWSGCTGNKAVVEVYHDSARAELYCNGKKVGAKKIRNYRARFRMKYAPGTLEARTYDASGKLTGTAVLTSASGTAELQICPEKDEIVSGETVFVNISITGENGVVESNADRELTVSVEGGELLGFGSAAPRTEESFVTGKYHTYYGRAIAAVRAGNAGEMKIVVREGSKIYEKEITVRERRQS